MSATIVSSPNALNALRYVDFDCSVRLQEVWIDTPLDVPELHEPLRQEIFNKLAEIKRTPGAASMGWPVVGPGGSGKAHLLGDFRRTAINNGASFVLVDMTDVRDFWETLLQGFIDSLQQDVGDGLTQQEMLLRRFLKFLCPKDPVEAVLARLTKSKPTTLQKNIVVILNYLQRYDHGKYRGRTLAYQDAIRAICCLNSDDFETQSIGYAWLQGQQLEPAAVQSFGFRDKVAKPRDIVRGICWYMSLYGPTVIAFDQLDPIVHQVGQAQIRDVEAREQYTSLQIVQQIGAGFAALRELDWTLPIVSCIESTWNMLPEICLASQLDRFQEQSILRKPSNGAVGNMIAHRLRAGFAQAGFEPPYPTWPFTAHALEELSCDTPRHALKVCDQHRRRMLSERSVEEITTFINHDVVVSPDKQQFSTLDQRFDELRKLADVDALLDEHAEDKQLAPLMHAALRTLVAENDERIPTDVDAVVECDFSGGANAKPLHSRLRFVFHNQRGRELHFCLRGIEWKNAVAYQNRLRSAMTHAGIDRNLSYRHLTIFRHRELPGGKVSQQVSELFCGNGGKIFRPTVDQLRSLSALNQLWSENAPDLKQWLRTRKPLGAMNELSEALIPDTIFAQLTSEKQLSQPSESKDPEVVAFQENFDRAVPKVPEAEVATIELTAKNAVNATSHLPLGRRVQSFGNGEILSLPVPVMCKHTMVLGGAGSGKTVTVRRIIEQAALAGIPALVIDCANDMCTFDQARESPSEHWGDGDAEAAKRFAACTEQIVWTPGREDGNPLRFEPIPDFIALRDNVEELKQAVKMVEGSLRDLVAPGSSQKSQSKSGILAASLLYFAQHSPICSLPAYINMLDELPDRAGLGIKNEQNLAQEMADSLKIAIAQNPMLSSVGTPLDPAILFGDERSNAHQRVRLSIISLIGLPGKETQCDFVNQLAMTLFAWIKKNPNPPAGRALRGLLVIDEARDYAPSQAATACKESLRQLAAQARKYKLGIVFATQHPKDIDTKIVGNCATHFYGRANSPASLQTLSVLMSQKGSNATDFPKLATGQFYVHFPDGALTTPAKIQLPDSLTEKIVLEEQQVLEKARVSRQRL